MKTLDELIGEKREQVQRLNTQLELLEELAREARGSTPRSERRRGRPPGRGQRRGRAGPGVNQQRVLKVLGATPMRARDIAAAAKLSAAATNQVLMGLKKNGVVQRAGRGLYSVGSKRTPVSTSRARRTPRKGGEPSQRRQKNSPKLSPATRATAASSHRQTAPPRATADE